MEEDQNKTKGRAFYDLEGWKKARELKNKILELITHFPSEEKFGLSDQMKRASRSIPACIAEGHGRFTYKDQVHFCIIARGSSSELLNHLIDAYDQKFISKEVLQEYQLRIEEMQKMLNGYIAYLRKLGAG